MEHVIREAIEIELHPDNMNKEEGFSLSKAWKPSTAYPEEMKKEAHPPTMKCDLVSTIPIHTIPQPILTARFPCTGLISSVPFPSSEDNLINPVF